MTFAVFYQRKRSHETDSIIGSWKKYRNAKKFFHAIKTNSGRVPGVLKAMAHSFAACNLLKIISMADQIRRLIFRKQRCFNKTY